LKHRPKIESIRFGKIIIDGHAYNRDVIVLPDRVLPNWWRVEGHSLRLEDLQQALADRLELLVVGTGIFGRMNVPDDVRANIESGGIELHVLATREACDLYNQMREEKRSAAALHITC